MFALFLFLFFFLVGVCSFLHLRTKLTAIGLYMDQIALCVSLIFPRPSASFSGPWAPLRNLGRYNIAYGLFSFLPNLGAA